MQRKIIRKQINVKDFQRIYLETSFSEIFWRFPWLSVLNLSTLSIEEVLSINFFNSTPRFGGSFNRRALEPIYCSKEVSKLESNAIWNFMRSEKITNLRGRLKNSTKCTPLASYLSDSSRLQYKRFYFSLFDYSLSATQDWIYKTCGCQLIISFSSRVAQLLITFPPIT